MSALLRFTVVLITLGILVLAVLGWLAKLHWFFDLFNHFRPQLLLASLGWTVVMLLIRKWRLGGMTALALALNAAAVLPGSVAESAAARPAARVLKVATINVLIRNTQFDRFTAYLRETQPDVVFLQEASAPWKPTLAALKDLYPYQDHYEDPGSYFGLAVLSRFPIQESGLISLSPVPGNRAMRATIQWHDTTIPFLNLHMPHPRSKYGVWLYQSMQQGVLVWLGKQRSAGLHPMVIGDMNCTPWSILQEDFLKASTLVETARGYWWSATRHRGLPDQLLIDQLFHDAAWTCTHRIVGPSIGSDHRPVVFELRLR